MNMLSSPVPDPARAPRSYTSEILLAPVLNELAVSFSSEWIANGALVAVGMAKVQYGNIHACQWSNGRIEFLEVPENAEYSAASRIYPSGAILGRFRDKFSEKRNVGLLWNSNGLNEIDPLEGDDSTSVSALNSHDLIVGYSSHSEVSTEWRPTIWYDLQPTALSTPAGMSFGKALDTNDSNMIVGGAFETGPNYASPIVWYKNKSFCLPSDGRHGWATNISGSNWVLGYLGAGEDNPSIMCVWDVNCLVAGGTVDDIVRYDFAATRNLHVKVNASSIREGNGAMEFLFNVDRQNGADRYHHPLLVRVTSLADITRVLGEDLNQLAPRVFPDPNLQKAFLGPRGIVLGEGLINKASRTAILTPRIN